MAAAERRFLRGLWPRALQGLRPSAHQDLHSLLILLFYIGLRTPPFLMVVLLIILAVLFQSCFDLLRSMCIIMHSRIRRFFRLLLCTFFSAERVAATAHLG